jgi:Cytochrome C oxidase, cbb3-type, subunit III
VLVGGAVPLMLAGPFGWNVSYAAMAALMGIDHGSTDGEIFDSIKNGVAPDFNMVPFKDQLKDEEIWNVVNYVRSIAKKK